MDIAGSIRSAFELLRIGRAAESEDLLKSILVRQPDNAKALYFLGIVYVRSGKYDLAIEHLSKSLRHDPSDVNAHLALGNAYASRRQFEEAIECYQSALLLSPRNVTLHNNLGNALAGAGRLDEAITSYQKALELNPGDATVCNNIGNAFKDKGNPEQAIVFYRKALLINPMDVAAHNNLGNAFRAAGDFDEAVAHYRKAIELDPAFAGAYNNLGNTLRAAHRFDEAIECYQKAVELVPTYAEAYYNLGSLLREDNKMADAHAAYDRAIELNPRDIRALWGRCLAELPIFYQDESDVLASRQNYGRHLAELHSLVSGMSPSDLKAVAGVAGLEQPFYLPYQGHNDRGLQELHGEVMCRIMASRYPQFAERPAMPPSSPWERLRVGFVSGFFCRHTNWKLFRGWFENLDRSRFDLYGYYTGKWNDQETAKAREYFGRFVENVPSFELLCRTIRDARLHILIYPEIGMDPIAARLAALRLAPVQCVSWGHPNTSGFPTIDYFLSSDLMEPENARDHYTEQLVRLPGLSIYYTQLESPAAEVDRESLGIRRNSVIYLCCQSLKKYLPRYDHVFPMIAREVGECQFLFISHVSDWVTEQFRQRIKHAFGILNLAADDCVVILPKLDPGRYHAVNCLSDVYLDSIGWSGGLSTLESLDCNLPIVTTPGELMRGRHSAAILEMIGVRDTVADTIQDYIDIAVKLGKDDSWRREISGKVAKNKHRAYRDMECISALQDFIEETVAERSTASGL